jgi:PAS domain S-box-containing protein
VDITERIKAEEALKAASASYARNLIEASPDPLVTISAEGRITDVNKATEIATGCSRDELIGSDFSSYFTEPEKAAAGYKHVFTEGFVKDYPLAIKHKSGTVTDVLYNASVYRNEAGGVQGVFAAARDITKRKKLEKQLQDSERLAAIGATAGMVGHDIRNPLQAIISDIYLAKSELSAMPDDKGKEGLKESIEGIEKNVEYINKIVADLQDYARPLTPVVKEIDLEKICQDILLRSNMPKNVEASCQIDEQTKQVMTDPELLIRIVTNLVINGVQAMPQGGKLTLRSYRQQGDLIIEVKDTGIGMPKKVKDKLFTPLFTTKSKGQGFGLAVVKRVTEAMNGTISVESEEGNGTTFRIRLPPPEK